LKPTLSLVLAVADNGVIGREGQLPWRLPDDLKHFKQVTWGKPVLMGRRTFESIGKPLAGRRNLVLSHSHREFMPGAEGVRSLNEALERVDGMAEICVIGGAALYALTLPSASQIYLTRVRGSPPGDTFFALSDLTGWREVQRMEHAADERHAYAMSFITLTR
jgi:dihydrofolate reductase